jgi:hypothetical protein
MAMNAAVGHRQSHAHAQRPQQRVIWHNSGFLRLTSRATNPAAAQAGIQTYAGLSAASVDDAAVSRLLSTPLAELMQEAAAVRDEAHSRIITFSPKVRQACSSCMPITDTQLVLRPASGSACGVLQ